MTIAPPEIYPWDIEFSDVEATLTETSESTIYLTIGERFNMSIIGCLPESWTGVYLYASLPEEESTSLVTLNDAYVVFIGSELLNTTLMENDSEDIL